MDFFKILNGGIGVSMSNFDRLWAKKFSGWPETELTGLLPLTFLSDGSALTDYRIYGTENGAGVQTENKIDVSMFTLGYTLDGTTGLPTVSQNRATTLTPIAISSSNAVIKCSYSGEGTFVFMYSVLNGNTLLRRTYSDNNPYLIDTSGGDTLYICVLISGGTAVDLSKISNLMLVEGSTAPTSYIPFGFKIPISNASGEQQSNYDLFIGDTQLGEEEYVDYGEQKVWKKPTPTIYGWHVDTSISNPAQAITYLGDAVGKTPAAMGASTFDYGDWSNAFFLPRPCMVKSDGTVDYYLDTNDYTKKLDGTASDIANAAYDGNAMMEWPLIWWKYEAGETEGEGYFYVSNVKVDNTYNCYCNINCDNQIVEHFYTAIYNGTGTTKLRSISGLALTSANGNGSTTYSQESTRALANNTTAKTEWFIDVWSDRMLINGLLILMGKSLNSQATFGRGLDSGSQAAKEAYVTGTLNNKGLFWGSTSSGAYGVKVFGMENWYSCVWHRTAGLIGLANGNTAYKMTYGTADGTTANGYNTTGDGYHINTVARPSPNYVKSCKFGDFGYLPLSTTGGSASTYYADYWYTNNSALTFALVGGGSGHGAGAGVSYVSLYYGAGYAYWRLAAALTLKPLAKQPYSPPLTPTDPPAPLPTINTYKDENTLSSEETVGEVTIKGKIKEAP